jgi:hypothetical protein
MAQTALLPEGRQRYFNNDGTPAAGGKLWTYAAGTSNPKATYSDAAGTIPNPNPVPLDAHGEAVVYWSGAYKVDIKQADGQQVTGYPVDNVASDPLGVARLFTILGAGLVGYGAGTVADALDALNLADYSALRAYAGAQKYVFVTGYLATKAPSGVAGLFIRDDVDTATADNGGTVIVSANGKRWKRVFDGDASVQWFGVSTSSADNAAALAQAFAACKRLVVPGTYGEVYRTSKYPRANGITVTGIGRPVFDLFYATTDVMVQFGDNSTHTNIKFNSTEADHEWQRAGIEQATGVVLNECGFYGFRHANVLPNAWGLYLANASDCVINRCDFGNNSQSDIALTDNNRNITIIHPTNATDSGVCLDIEPNGTQLTNGVMVLGGRFRKVYLLENDYTTYAGRNVSFVGVRVDNLVYDGTEAVFDDACSIGAITNENNQYAFAGNLNATLGLSGNLIDDPYLVDMAPVNAAGEWMADYVSTTWAADRVRDAAGTYVRLNKNNLNQAHWMKSKKIPLLTGTNPLLLLHIGRAQLPADAAWGGKRAYVEFFNAGGGSLGISYVITARGLAGATTPMMPHWAVVNPPAGATHAVWHFAYSGFVVNGGSFSTICDHVVAMGMFEISGLEKTANTRDIATALLQGSNNIVTRATQVPNTAQHVGAPAGTRVLKKSPAVGSTPGWVCVATGAPGTWAAEAILTAA